MKLSAAKTLLIVGGGHASLPIIKMGKKWKQLNIIIKLVSAHPYLIYSGSLPQYMGGFYQWSQTAVNLEGLCEKYTVQFIKGFVQSVDSEEKSVTTADGEVIHYDFLLLNISAETKPLFEDKHITPVKPLSKLLKLRENILNGGVKNLLIIGGGTAGSELALNLSHPKLKYRPVLTLAEKNSRILSSYKKKLSNQVTNSLLGRGVNVLTDKVSTPDFVKGFEHVILAAGNQPHSVSIKHSFITGESGRILTDRTLQVKGEPSVFAAGDMADVNGNNYQPIGVHAVKQGVLLRKNIKVAIIGTSLAMYKPYPVHPLILSNGPDSAILIIGKWSFSGRSYAILKYILDMRWLDKYTKVSADRRSDLRLLLEGIKRSR